MELDTAEMPELTNVVFDVPPQTYSCPGPDSMYKIFRIVEVPHVHSFFYDYTRTVHQLPGMTFLFLILSLQISNINCAILAISEFKF